MSIYNHNYILAIQAYANAYDMALAMPKTFGVHTTETQARILDNAIVTIEELIMED